MIAGHTNAAAPSIVATTFANRLKTTGAEKASTFAELVERLQKPREYADKLACPLLKLGRFKGASRAQGAEILGIVGLEGDYDGGQVSIDEAARRLSLAGASAFLYTSASHTAKAPRWRVLAPLSRVHTPAEHATVLALLNGALGGILAPECFEPTRCYFFGKVQGVAYETRVVQGEYIDLLSVAITPIGKPLSPSVASKVAERSLGHVDDLDRLAALSRVDAGTIADLRSALASTPAVSGHWYSTINMLASLKNTALSDNAFELADEFSQRFSNYDLDELARVWDRTNPTGITYRSIFTVAEANGWKNTQHAEVVAPQLATTESVAAATVGTTNRRFRRQSMEEITSRPPQVWRVKGLIPSTGVAMIYGASTSGKSFFAIDLGMCIARGEAWRGKTTKPGAVVYVCAEAVDDFAKRVTAYKKHHGVSNLPFETIDEVPNLMVKADVEALIIELTRAPVGVVFFDTLACVSVGGDENTAKDMAILLAHCKLISRVTGALVVLVHHTGKDESKGARGSSSLYGAMDTVIEISRAGDVRAAKVTKQKGGPDGQEFGFKLIPVPVGLDEDGDEIASCVIEHTQAVPKAQRKIEPKGDNEVIVLRTLQRTYDLTGEGMFSGDLIAASVSELTRSPTAKQDRRSFVCTRAIDSLKAKNRIEEINGRLIPA